MNNPAILILILVLQHCARGVDSTRPCKALSNAQGAESYELRPANGYFTLVDRGSTNAAELELEACDRQNFVGSDQNGLPNTGGGDSKETRQRSEWPETEYAEKKQNFAASKDVVVTLEEKPMDQEKERLVAAGRSNPEEDLEGKKEVPAAYVIIRGRPKLDQDSNRNRDQMVTISLDTLNGLIKGSLIPPSAPSLDQNWYVASLRNEKKSFDDTAAGDEQQMVLLRVVPAATAAGQDVVSVADSLPGFQEVADGTYRIKD